MNWPMVSGVENVRSYGTIVDGAAADAAEHRTVHRNCLHHRRLVWLDCRRRLPANLVGGFVECFEKYSEHCCDIVVVVVVAGHSDHDDDEDADDVRHRLHRSIHSASRPFAGDGRAMIATDDADSVDSSLGQVQVREY